MKTNIVYILRSVLMAFLLITLSNATLKAQTKEETIAWIAQKINNNGQKVDITQTSSYPIFETYSCDKKTIKAVDKRGQDGSDNFFGMYRYIDLDDITGAEISSYGGYQNLVLRTSKNIVQIQIDPGKPDDNKTILCMGTCNSCPVYLNWNAEPDLINRMLKAFQTLISFNKPKETF